MSIQGSEIAGFGFRGIVCQVKIDNDQQAKF
jgi:hypothetical protein